MADTATRLTYTDVELRSYLPSGWGIRRGAAGRWDAAKGEWKIEVYDPADNVWPLVVAGRNASSKGRLEALQHGVELPKQARQCQPAKPETRLPQKLAPRSRRRLMSWAWARRTP